MQLGGVPAVQEDSSTGLLLRCLSAMAAGSTFCSYTAEPIIRKFTAQQQCR